MAEKGTSQQNQADSSGEPLDDLIRRPPRKIGLLVGGAMTLTAGALCMVNGLGSLLGGAAVAVGPDTGQVNLAVCGFIVVFLGAIAIAGGMTAILGKHISLALAGAAAGMMGGGNAGFWLGLVSLLLIAFSDVDI